MDGSILGSSVGSALEIINGDSVDGATFGILVGAIGALVGFRVGRVG